MAKCVTKVPEIPTLDFNLTKHEALIIRQLIGNTCATDARQLGCKPEWLRNNGRALDDMYTCFNKACKDHFGEDINASE